jgi:hypothetical protein
MKVFVAAKESITTSLPTPAAAWKTKMYNLSPVHTTSLDQLKCSRFTRCVKQADDSWSPLESSRDGA